MRRKAGSGAGRREGRGSRDRAPDRSLSKAARLDYSKPMFKGNLSPEIMAALLETLPVEFSITDADDKVVAWNKHETRIFRRTDNVLGRNVRACHPKQSLQKVEAILSEMKAGKREKAEFWIDLQIDGSPEKVLIQYHALRDAAGKYIGCLECSQKIGRIQSLSGQKRLLD
jgi:PAS domain S-box-containing protein